MRQNLIRRAAAHALLAICTAVCVPLANAQSRPAPNYMAAVANAAREISRDPCNARSKFAGLISALEAAAKQDQVGVDAPFMVERMAGMGCSNSRLTLSKTELLLNAGRQGWLNSCAYSPGKDYSAELAMSGTSYNPEHFKLTQQDLESIPCGRAFIAAVLTQQELAPADRVAAPPPEAAPTTSPQRRRRQ